MSTRPGKIESVSSEHWNFVYFLSFIIGLTYVYIYFKRMRYQNITSNMPTLFGLPFIGIALELFPVKRFLYKVGSFFEELNTLTFCAWLGMDPFIITIDPEIIKTITTSSEYLNKAETLYIPLDNAIPQGVITSEANKWKHNRKLMNAYFNHKTLTGLIPLFNRSSKVAAERLSKISDSGEHKLFDFLIRVSLEASIEATMGIEMKEGSIENNKVADAFTNLMKSIANAAAYSTLGVSFLARTPIYYKTLRYLRNFVEKLIEQRTNNKTSSCDSETWTDSDEATPTKSFLDLFLSYCEKGRLQKEDVIVESITLIGASFETLGTTIYSALLMLAMHPDIQEKLFNELYALFPQKDMEFTYDQLKQVPYLDMVMAETLRLMPPIPIIGRETIHETRLTSQLSLPPKLQIIVPIFSLHRSETWWGSEAHLFNPDNFLPENIAKRNPFVYMPFSKGARNCVGRRYGEIATRVILSRLVRNFKLSTSFKYEDIHFVDHISLCYDVEPNLRIKSRKN